MTKRRTSHPFAIAALIAAGLWAISAGGARAGVIHDYTITTSQVFQGTVSGSFETTDTAITTFDITGVTGTIPATTVTFDSAQAGSSTVFVFPFTLDDDVTPVLQVNFFDGLGDRFLFDAAGGFASGLSYVPSGTTLFLVSCRRALPFLPAFLAPYK